MYLFFSFSVFRFLVKCIMLVFFVVKLFSYSFLFQSRLFIIVHQLLSCSMYLQEIK